MSLLGLDVGSSACKAATFDENGNLLAVASREYSAESQQPDWVEMNPDVMWHAAVATIKDVCSRTADPVRALAVSSHGETFIPVGIDGKAVGPAIMNADNRATEQVRFFSENMGKERIYSITGCVLHPMYALLKILWLKENRQDLYQNAVKFVGAGDYILACMGFEPVTDFSLASRTMAFDINRRAWSQEIIDLAGLRVNQFPEARPSGTPVGTITGQMAEILGVADGAVVSLGGHDQPCGALGAGVVDSGDAADSAGTYECLTVVSDKPTLGADALSHNLNSYYHLLPDKYVTLAFFPAGVVMRWFRDEFASQNIDASSGRDAYDLLTQNLSNDPSGICFIPHFIGSGNPTWNVNATGVVVGLRPDKSRYHMFQAIMEGVACELRINLEILQRLVGEISMLRTTGGGAKSDYWMQLRADITGKTVASMQSSEAVCLGAAVAAGVGAGVFNSLEEGSRAVAKFARIFEPDSARATRYVEQIAQYNKIYPALAGSGVY